MKCEQCRALLEEYVDGELDHSTAAAMATHRSICQSCSLEYESLLREQEIYASYQRGIEINPALWASVKAGIDQEKKAARSRGYWSRLRGWLGGLHTPMMSPAWVAALVVLAVGITVLVMVYINGRTPGTREIAKQGYEANQTAPSEGQQSGKAKPAETPGLAGPESGPAKPPEIAVAKGPKPVKPRVETVAAKPNAANTASAKPTAAQLVKQAEEKYLAAIALLSRDIDKNRSQLDPATIARFEGALTSINQTIAETRRAVREHPGDPVAAQYMLMAYAEKVDVLKEMAGAQ